MALESAAAPVAAAPLVEAVLPTLVFGLVEVHRLRRELEALDAYFTAEKLRSAGTQPSLPRVSRLLEALAAENHGSLLQAADRERLQHFILTVVSSAPTVHISFAADPSSAFLAKLVSWLRHNIHPLVLVQIGLQPTIAAGCVVRTNNHVFDLSLRHRFDDQRAALIAELDKKIEAAA